MSTWKPRRLTPAHLEVFRLYFQGYSQLDIAKLTGYDRAWICKMLNGPDANDLLEQFQAKTINTILDVQSDAQAIAPRVFEEKIRLALNAKDERTRNIACTDILNMAGHRPIHRVVMENADPVLDKYADLTEDQLREQLAGKPIVVVETVSKPEEPTLH